MGDPSRRRRAALRRPAGVAARLVALALVAAAAGGCASGDERAGVIMRLERLGFFDHTDPAKLAAVRKEVERDPTTGVFSVETNRFFFADAEDLTEGGVGAFLREIGPVLRQAGIAPPSVEEDLQPDHYDVVVDGRRYRIYGPAEVESDLIWGYAGARTVMLLNDLLARAGSPERAYGVSGGNDFGIFLLTPDLRDEVASVIASRRDEPYEATDRPPNFGWPGG